MNENHQELPLSPEQDVARSEQANLYTASRMRRMLRYVLPGRQAEQSEAVEIEAAEEPALLETTNQAGIESEARVQFYVQQWHQGVERGMSEGWLHPSVAPRTINRWPHITITDTAEDIGEMLGGKHVDGEVMVLKGEEHVLVHELNHAVLTDRQPTVPGFEARQFAVEWINEAVTEHMAETMKQGSDIERIDISHGVYTIERAVLNSLLIKLNNEATQPEDRISMSDVCRLYTTPINEAIPKKMQVFKDVTVGIYAATHTRSRYELIGEGYDITNPKHSLLLMLHEQHALFTTLSDLEKTSETSQQLLSRYQRENSAIRANVLASNVALTK